MIQAISFEQRTSDVVLTADAIEEQSSRLIPDREAGGALVGPGLLHLRPKRLGLFLRGSPSTHPAN